MDGALENYPDDSWSISEEWGRFRQLSLVPSQVEGKLRELDDPFLGGMESDRHLSSSNSQPFLGGMTAEESQPTKIPPRNSQPFLGGTAEDEGQTQKIPPRKRRRKGDGTGYIYHRTVTKRGKPYQEAYYHYEVYEDGDRLVKSSLSADRQGSTSRRAN